MHGSGLLAKLARRIGAKLAGMLPLLVGAAALVGGLTLLLALATPALPEAYRQLLQQLGHGDWVGGRERLARLVDGYGSARIYAFLGGQVLQVLVAPIPGQLLGLLGGYLFGFWQGLALTMGGLMLGSLLAMVLGRTLGTLIARRLVPRRMLQTFDYLVDHSGLWNFFLLFLLPALPDDALCLIAGMTRLSLPKLLLVCALGRLPGMAVLTFVGSGAGGNVALANAVLLVATGAAALLWLFSDEAEAFFHRLSQGHRTQTPS